MYCMNLILFSELVLLVATFANKLNEKYNIINIKEIQIIF